MASGALGFFFRPGEEKQRKGREVGLVWEKKLPIQNLKARVSLPFFFLDGGGRLSLGGEGFVCKRLKGEKGESEMAGAPGGELEKK